MEDAKLAVFQSLSIIPCFIEISPFSFFKFIIQILLFIEIRPLDQAITAKYIEAEAQPSHHITAPLITA